MRQKSERKIILFFLSSIKYIKFKLLLSAQCRPPKFSSNTWFCAPKFAAAHVRNRVARVSGAFRQIEIIQGAMVRNYISHSSIQHFLCLLSKQLITRLELDCDNSNSKKLHGHIVRLLEVIDGHRSVSIPYHQ